MSIHRIHLRGPWSYEWLGGPDVPFSHSGTVTMPCEWRSIFGETKGTVRFRRSFHRPTNLEPHEQVSIVLTEVGGHGNATLNGIDLGRFASGNEVTGFVITTVLKPFNELVIELSFNPAFDPGLSGGLFGLVALEIRNDQAE